MVLMGSEEKRVSVGWKKLTVGVPVEDRRKEGPVRGKS